MEFPLVMYKASSNPLSSHWEGGTFGPISPVRNLGFREVSSLDQVLSGSSGNREHHFLFGES